MPHFNEEEIKKLVGGLWLRIWSFFYWLGEPPIPKLWKPLHLIFACWGIIRFTESFTVVSGVVQLLNKMDGRPFNQNDENLFEVNICVDVQKVMENKN